LFIALLIGESILTQQPRISRDELVEMFANIQAKTPWDIKGEMLWGYFFTGNDKSDLERIGAELVGHAYRLVEIRELERDAAEEMPEWQLHVERVEIHTADTLYARNTQLEDLASRYNTATYDGMDVGPVN
jgi:hypothetical protein